MLTPHHPTAWPSHVWLLAAQRDADLSFPSSQAAALQSRGQPSSGLLTAPWVILTSRESLPCPLCTQRSSLLHPLPSSQVPCYTSTSYWGFDPLCFAGCSLAPPLQGGFVSPSAVTARLPATATPLKVKLMPCDISLPARHTPKTSPAEAAPCFLSWKLPAPDT